MILTNDNGTISESTAYVIKDSESGEVLFVFDMVEECEFKASSTVVTYPTERGIEATDYKYDNPDNIKLKCFLQKGKQLVDDQKRDNKVLTLLEKYKTGLYAIDIQTKAGLRTKYTISGYTIPENIDNYSLLEIDLECQQVLDFSQEQTREDSDKDTQKVGIVQVREYIDGKEVIEV